ncbi:hypothetical protein Tco_0607827 [Tanacetum coccineum]
MSRMQCNNVGKVLLPRLNETSEPLNRLLDYSQSATSRFRDQIRIYMNYHRIGSLLPKDGTQPRYAQLWFFDAKNEIRNRLGAFIEQETGEGADETIVGSVRY